MESFPSPSEPKESKVLSSLEKGVLIGGALFATTSEGIAQPQTSEMPDTTITIQENPHLQQETYKIMQYVTTIENEFKHFAKKINKEDKTIIAIVKESEALGQYKYNGANDWESLATDGGTVELVTDHNRTYTITSRDRQTVSALMKERNLVTDQKNGKNKSEIFSVYTPVDYYFTVGTEIQPDNNSIVVRIRCIDMHTKVVIVQEKEVKFEASAEWKEEWKRTGEIDRVVKEMIDGML